jgi:hypothetical protein
MNLEGVEHALSRHNDLQEVGGEAKTRVSSVDDRMGREGGREGGRKGGKEGRAREGLTWFGCSVTWRERISAATSSAVFHFASCGEQGKKEARGEEDKACKNITLIKI